MVHWLNGLNGLKLNWRLALLALTVTAVHGCVADGVAESMTESAASFNGQAMPARIEVAYVKDMALTAPPATAPVPAAPAAAPAPVRRAAAAPSRAASAVRVPAPAAAASTASLSASLSESAAAITPADDVAAQTAETLSALSAPPTASATSAPPSSPTLAARDDGSGADLAAAPPSPGASSGAFSWPASTRMSYVLTGNYRGEINGSAQVDWVRQDERYQVHLDIQVGLPFAPLLSRKMSSEGRLTAEGLRPERYDEESKVMFRAPRRVGMRFEPDAVVLANGQRLERWAGVQDTASQFVQMAYLFTTQPGLLKPGGTVELPLALPRNVDRWVYDVLEPETLQTPFGPVDTFHLKPRRLARATNDLSAEIWFAPQLQYLPVRIRIAQDAETHIDLMISRRPQLAAQ